MIVIALSIRNRMEQHEYVIKILPRRHLHFRLTLAKGTLVGTFDLLHVDLLQSIRNCVDTAASKRPITNWITLIKLHLNEASTSTSSFAGT